MAPVTPKPDVRPRDSSRRSTIRDAIERQRVIAVVRVDNFERAAAIANALVAGGIRIIEVTLTTPGHEQLIADLARRGDIIIGAGTVLTEQHVRTVDELGAMFFASPIFDPRAVATALELDMVAIPGVATPTEMVTALQAGADLLKLFPMPPDPIRYLRALGGPFPDLPLAPSGGVTRDNAAALLAAGARTLFVGSWLADDERGSPRRPSEISSCARELLAAVDSIPHTLPRSNSPH